MIVGAQLMAALALVGAAYPAYCLSAQITRPGARYLLGLCVFGALIPILSALTTGTDGVHIRHALMTFIGPLYFLGMAEYLGVFSRWRAKLEIGLTVYVCAMVFWALPAEWHASYLSFPVEQPHKARGIYLYQIGFGAWVMKLVSYGLLVTASAAALQRFRVAQAKFIYSLCFVFLPLTLGTVDLSVSLLGRPPTLDVSLNQIVIVVSLYIWTYGLARSRLILRTPVSRVNLLNHMQEAYCVLGSEGEITDCNRRFAVFVGSKRRALIGFDAATVLPAGIVSELADKRFTNRRIVISGTDGDRVFDATLVPLSDSSAAARPAMLLTLRDQTKAQEMAASLEEKEQELEAAYERLDRMSSVDSLTGLANLHGLTAEFVNLGQKSSTASRPASDPIINGIILVDIDSFAQINESHGYAIGDAVLVELARAMEATCRRSDTIARVAGEEFVVLATSTNRERLQGAAQRLHKHIRHTRIRLANNVTLQVTASIGATEIRPGQTLDEAIAAAGMALKRAKRGGRDRVEFGGSENVTPLSRDDS